MAGSAEAADASADNNDAHQANPPTTWAARSSSAARTCSGIGARASAATAQAWRRRISCSTSSRAPQSTSRLQRRRTSARLRSGAPTPVEKSCGGGPATIPRHCQQQGGLSVSQVGANGFAAQQLVTESADQVIAELEGVAQGPAEGRVRKAHLCQSAGQRRAQVQRPLHGVSARLQAGNADRSPPADPAPRCASQVEVLAHDQLQPEFIPHAVHLGGRLPGAGEQTIGASEGQVAEQDRHPLPEPAGLTPPTGPAVVQLQPAVHAGATPPGFRAIHDIVVQQRESVQQLQRGGHIRNDGVVGTSRPEIPVPAEGRPQPLAAL